MKLFLKRRPQDPDAHPISKIRARAASAFSVRFFTIDAQTEHDYASKMLPEMLKSTGAGARRPIAEKAKNSPPHFVACKTLRRRALFGSLLAVGLITACATSRLHYPETRRVSQADDYHGSKVAFHIAGWRMIMRPRQRRGSKRRIKSRSLIWKRFRSAKKSRSG